MKIHYSGSAWSEPNWLIVFVLFCLWWCWLSKPNIGCRQLCCSLTALNTILNTAWFRYSSLRLSQFGNIDFWQICFLKIEPISCNKHNLEHFLIKNWIIRVCDIESCQMYVEVWNVSFNLAIFAFCGCQWHFVSHGTVYRVNISPRPKACPVRLA